MSATETIFSVALSPSHEILFSDLCEAGKYLDQAEGCKNCSANHWSAAGNTEASCTACPTGKEVAAGQGKQESDCSWSEWFFLSSELKNATLS